jgi:DNA-binding MltR family transcriptional regulator
MSQTQSPNDGSTKREKSTDFNFVTMIQEADRGCALVVAEGLNDMLGTVYREIMQKKGANKTDIDEMIENVYAPLGTFAVKIKIGYWLGVIGPKTYDAMETIRKIRNLFAHHAGPLDFTDTKIGRLVRKLEKHLDDANRPTARTDNHSIKHMFGNDTKIGYVKTSENREIFMKASVILTLLLICRQGEDSPLLPQW